MLELLIGIFLFGFCAFPLTQLPLKALREEIKSAYRMQMHRYADIAFSEVKEKLYCQEITWKEISSPANNPVVLLKEKGITIDLNKELGKRTFDRKVTLHSVGKKGQNGEEYRLATVKVTFKPKEKKSDLFRVRKGSKISSRSFIYKVFIKKAGLAEQPQEQKELVTPVKETIPPSVP